MNKCKCGQISDYKVQSGRGPILDLCEACMINEITNSKKSYRVDKKAGVSDKNVMAGQGPYVGAIKDARAELPKNVK